MVLEAVTKLLNVGKGYFLDDPSLFSELSLFMPNFAGCSLSFGVGDAWISCLKTVHIFIFVQMFRFEPQYAFCISFLKQIFIIFLTVSRNGSESEVELREYDPWAKIPILRQFQFKHKKLLHMKNLSIAWGLDNFSVSYSKYEKINLRILCFSQCS